MKKAIISFIGFFFALIVSMPVSVEAQALAKKETAKKQTAKADTPDLAWNKSKHVFGSIEHQKPVIAEFEFINNSKKPVAITKVGTTCGCTAPVYSKEPVKPGEKGIVKVRFDAVAPGFFKKGAKIHFSDGTAKEVEIEGKVVVRQQNIKKR